TERTDELSVLLAKFNLEFRWLAHVLLDEPLERGAVGLAVTDVVVLVNGLAVPLEGQQLADERDVERLPDAGRPREILSRDRTFVERAAVVEGKSVDAVAVVHLDFEQTAIVDAGIAPLGDGEFDVQLIVFVVFDRHDVRPSAVAAAKHDGVGPAS